MPANAVNAVMQKITATLAILLRLFATVLSSLGMFFQTLSARRHSTDRGYNKIFFRGKTAMNSPPESGQHTGCLTGVHPGALSPSFLIRKVTENNLFRGNAEKRSGGILLGQLIDQAEFRPIFSQHPP